MAVVRARCVWLRPGPTAPDISARCSMTSPSNTRRSRDAPGCDARSSAWPRNVGRSVSRAPRRGRTPCDRARSPRRSRRATFVRETGQARGQAGNLRRPLRSHGTSAGSGPGQENSPNTAKSASFGVRMDVIPALRCVAAIIVSSARFRPSRCLAIASRNRFTAASSASTRSTSGESHHARVRFQALEEKQERIVPAPFELVADSADLLQVVVPMATALFQANPALPAGYSWCMLCL